MFITWGEEASISAVMLYSKTGLKVAKNQVPLYKGVSVGLGIGLAVSLHPCRDGFPGGLKGHFAGRISSPAGCQRGRFLAGSSATVKPLKRNSRRCLAKLF